MYRRQVPIGIPEPCSPAGLIIVYQADAFNFLGFIYKPTFGLRTSCVGHVALAAVSTGKSYLNGVGAVNFLHVSSYLCV